MPKPELIAPKAPSTPVSFGGSRKSSREIPKDLLKEVSHRLDVMALLAAASMRRTLFRWSPSIFITQQSLLRCVEGLKFLPSSSALFLCVLQKIRSRDLTPPRIFLSPSPPS